jgi:hypothetical protein
MPLAGAIVLHQIFLELSTHGVGPINAHANEPGPSTGKGLDDRDSNILFEALSDNELLTQMQEYLASHWHNPSFEAAASREAADLTMRKLEPCSSRP